MKKFKIIQNIPENGQKQHQPIQMRQYSLISSDCTASDICSVQRSFCIDSPSFESEQASFSQQRSLSADSDINMTMSSRDKKVNICLMSCRKK